MQLHTDLKENILIGCRIRVSQVSCCTLKKNHLKYTHNRPSISVSITSSAAFCTLLPLLLHLLHPIKDLSFSVLPFGIFSSSLLPFIYLSACSHSPSPLHCRLSSVAELVIENQMYSCDELLSFNHSCFIPVRLDRVGHCCHIYKNRIHSKHASTHTHNPPSSHIHLNSFHLYLLSHMHVQHETHSLHLCVHRAQS